MIVGIFENLCGRGFDKPGRDSGGVDLEGLGGGIPFNQCRRIVVSGRLDPVPGIQEIRGNVRVVDDQSIVSLGTESRDRPIRAPRQNALWRSVGVAKDYKFVVSKVPSLNDTVE